MFWKKIRSEKHRKIHRKTPVPGPLLDKVAGRRKETLEQVFSFAKINGTFFYNRTPLVAASELTMTSHAPNN